MDKQQLQSVLPRKKTEQSKSKKNNNNPVKVVYISNPMKVKICASKFRALVQELTGQYASLPDPAKFVDDEDDVGGSTQTHHQTTVDDYVMMNSSLPNNENDSCEAEDSTVADVLSRRSDLDFQPFVDDNDMFIPQMMNMDNNFNSIVSPSNFELYETSGHKLMF